MLKDNPELFQLYKDLVVSNVITAEEFWANRGKVFDIDFPGVLQIMIIIYVLSIYLYFYSLFNDEKHFLILCK